MALEAVEICPLVVEICRRYFDCPSGLKTHVMDGRRFIQTTTQRYDLAFIDAYDSEDYPAHLGTRQFFEALRRVLSPGGVAVANLSPSADAHQADLLRTFQEVFPVNRCYSTQGGNTVSVGLTAPAPDSATVRRRVRELDRKSKGHLELGEALGRPCAVDLGTARVLVDGT
jgi:spermidine synthase